MDRSLEGFADSEAASRSGSAPAGAIPQHADARVGMKPGTLQGGV